VALVVFFGGELIRIYNIGAKSGLEVKVTNGKPKFCK
jgi:hypothetical protein